jgi:hypothetical protein
MLKAADRSVQDVPIQVCVQGSGENTSPPLALSSGDVEAALEITFSTRLYSGSFKTGVDRRF